MPAIYLNVDERPTDYWLNDGSEHAAMDSVLVDLSDDFIQRYHEAVDNYDGIQAELELIYKSKEV